MSWNGLLLVLVLCLATAAAPAARQTDEAAIRQIVADAIRRLNQGDLIAIREFWDENADYVGIGGEFIHGRPAMEAFFAQLLKAGFGTETGRSEEHTSELQSLRHLV